MCRYLGEIVNEATCPQVGTANVRRASALVIRKDRDLIHDCPKEVIWIARAIDEPGQVMRKVRAESPLC